MLRKKKIIFSSIMIILTVIFAFAIVTANKDVTEYTKTHKAFDKTTIFSEQVYHKSIITFSIIGIWIFLRLKLYKLREIKKKKHKITVVREKDVEYFRELPQRIDLEPAFASLYYYSNISTRKLKNGLIGGFILKWSQDNNIKIIDKGNQVFAIDLQNGDFAKTEYEQRLYAIIKEAARENNLLENVELYSWSRNPSNESKLNEWYNDILNEWDKKLKYNYCKDNLKSEAEALIGLKKFLLDYSLIDERRHKEVKIWENYLICAQLLGITDQVNRQFKEIYPENGTISQVVVKTQEKSMFAMIAFVIAGIFINACAMLTTAIISIIYFIINMI